MPDDVDINETPTEEENTETNTETTETTLMDKCRPSHSIPWPKTTAPKHQKR